jgi:hypothetical protein
MTLSELLTTAHAKNPGMRFAYNAAENGVAYWDEQQSRWTLGAAKTITGQWVSGVQELLVNGKPAWPQEDWIEHVAEMAHV